ncbi:hypothetical protein MVEN_00495200 [Mycena venus]|uniref:F-box domain-containing protein n=1 Tax=Mycena venus TaxID=2733690 RepID=A0A8H6YVW2_9AGAR|nr:hypothetical protein MVEN_00495200 [Mycena venus]
MSSGMLDLPTEILELIFEPLPNESLLCIALLSRRLNAIALSFYFQRCNDIDLVAKSAELTLSPARWDAVCALQISIATPPLERLKCTIPRPPGSINAYYLELMKRLETLIARLSRLREVAVELRVGVGRRPWVISARSSPWQRAWVAQVEALLKCIVRQDCRCLTFIDDTYYLEESYQDQFYGLFPCIKERLPAGGKNLPPLATTAVPCPTLSFDLPRHQIRHSLQAAQL